MAVALRGSYLEQGVVVFVVAEFVHCLFVAVVVAASEVSINKIKLPRDVTRPPPGGFPFLLHISAVHVPPRRAWSCCLLRVADGGHPPAAVGADAPDGSLAVPQVVLRQPGRACRRGQGRADQTISFGALLDGRFSLVCALFYLVALTLGAVAAALLLRLATGGAYPPGFALALGDGDCNAVLLAVGFLLGAMVLVGGPFVGTVMHLDRIGLLLWCWKRPWGPFAKPWGPAHVLWVRWQPDAWHATASRGWCSSTPSLWTQEICECHAYFGQVNFFCQYVVFSTCIYGSGKAVASARVDR